LNPLEEWIHSLIRSEAAESSEFQMHLGKKHLDMVKKEDVTKYKLYKLRKVLHYVFERSPFYRRLFRKTGVEPQDLKTIQDFAKLPFTELKSISENPYKFLCVSQSKVLRGFTVEGFFEPSRRIFFTEKELKEIVESVAAGLKMTGLRKGSVVQIVYPWEPEWGLPHIVERGIQLGGGKPVATGSLKFEKQVKEIERNNPSIIIGPNPYLREFTGWAKNRIDLKRLRVESLVLSRGCDFFPFSESIRKELEESWGCKVFDHYGVTEASFTLALECWKQNGLHLNEYHAYVEVIDPKSGETVDIGEEGELVFTTLNRTGMPFIRYRSKDIAALIDEPCQCGAKVNRRITGIKRKLEEITW
jgi:phenylacetate-CoA ligase